VNKLRALLERLTVWHVVVPVAVASATAMYLVGNWVHASAPAQGDAVQIFGLVERMYRTGEMRWAGVPSRLELNHPGSALLLLLLAGRWLAAVVGVEPQVAMVVVYVVACVGLVALGCVALARAAGGAATGMAALVVYLAMTVAWRVGLPDWQVTSAVWPWSGFVMYPILPPLLGTYLTFACGALVLAVGRWRPAPYLCLVVGGWNFQVFTENAPLGLVVGVVGVAGVGVDVVKVARRRRASGSSSARRASAVLSSVGAGVACWMVGFGPFAVRMMNEGFDLPRRYVEQSLAVKRAMGANEYDAGWLGRLGDAWHTGPVTPLVVAAMVGVVGYGLVAGRWRRHALVAVAAMPVVVFYLAYASTSASYQTSLLASLVPLVLAFPVGVALSKLPVPALAAVAVVAPVVVLGVFLPRIDVPLAAYRAAPALGAVVDEAMRLTEEGEVVGVVVHPEVLSGDFAAPASLLGIDYQLFRRGRTPCAAPVVEGVSAQRPGRDPSPECVPPQVEVFVRVVLAGSPLPDSPVAQQDYRCGNDQDCTVAVYDLAVGARPAGDEAGG
jgi:hypothetical protein